MSQSSIDEDREKLRQYFLTLPEDQQAKGWDCMWQQKITPWDRKQPNPALVDTLVDKAELSRSPWKRGESSGKERKRVLVPGCGRGYDVLLFAAYGFDSYGLDASATAIEAANELLRVEEKDQPFPVQNDEVGRGRTKFIQADFFDEDPLSHLASGKCFDVIYDYTFLCALPPSLRPRWAARMSDLLSPEGTLICIEFPLNKDPNLGGPPHGLQHELYEALFAKPGEEVGGYSDGDVNEADNALVRTDTWIPQRVFEGQGKATMVSLWQHSKR